MHTAFVDYARLYSFEPGCTEESDKQEVNESSLREAALAGRIWTADFGVFVHCASFYSTRKGPFNAMTEREFLTISNIEVDNAKLGSDNWSEKNLIEFANARDLLSAMSVSI